VKPGVSPLTAAEIETRIGPHLDELLALWWIEQGADKPRDLNLIASSIPFAHDEPLRVLDLCCGPGDVGRAIHHEFPNAEIDGVDRDSFLATICAIVNQRRQIPGAINVADLNDSFWQFGLSGPYDVIATVNALHWFAPPSAEKLAQEIHALLRSGGIFLFAEPAATAAPFAAGVDAWKAKQPQRYSRKAWEDFWSRANALLGYDHTQHLGPRDANRIDDTLTVAGWIDLIQNAGFTITDVLWRDADQVIIAALKP
jgi:trans-aconitate 2-methyltransferase